MLLVHVSDIPAGLWTTTSNIGAGLRELVRPIVDHAVSYARSLDPSVQVRGRVILGSPHRTLASMSAECVLTVVGRQGRGAVAAHLVGSLSLSLGHAHNPVVAVTPDADSADRTIERVVVLGDHPTSRRALDFGVAEARLHRVELQVVHAWPVPSWPPTRGTVEEPESEVPAVRIAAEARRVSARPAAAASCYEDVGMSSVVLAGRPVQVLREFCREFRTEPAADQAWNGQRPHSGLLTY